MGSYIFRRLHKAPAAKRPRQQVTFCAEARASRATPATARALTSRVKLCHR